MKQRLTFYLYLLLVTSVYSQASRTTYYTSEKLEREVQVSKARFSQTISTLPDGSVSTEVRNVKEDFLISYVTYKGDEPVGVWKMWHNGVMHELDYNFEVIYRADTCSGSLLTQMLLQNSDSLVHKEPIISLDETTFYHYIFNNIFYPGKARLGGIQGKVYLTFAITEDGEINNIAVQKGQHISIDKEAMRVIRTIKLLTTSILNGKSIPVCMTLPIAFMLQ